MSPDEQRSYLLNEIPSYNRDMWSQFNKSMGFQFLVLGWLLTSSGVRQFLSHSIWATSLAILASLLTAGMVCVLARKVYQRSCVIRKEANNLGVPDALIDNRILNGSLMQKMAMFHIITSGLTIAILISPFLSI